MYSETGLVTQVVVYINGSTDRPDDRRNCERKSINSCVQMSLTIVVTPADTVTKHNENTNYIQKVQ